MTQISKILPFVKFLYQMAVALGVCVYGVMNLKIFGNSFAEPPLIRHGQNNVKNHQLFLLSNKPQ